MFDENDGFFDHVPPPAPPSREGNGFAGGSSVSTTGEYHLVPSAGDKADERPALIGRPYGLGPRVPMYVVSPWSRGGWVDSQLFDHTSVIRFLERRFGVHEPNISPWRRAVCGDLTSAFDFRRPNDARNWQALPATGALAKRAAALPGRTPAVPPAAVAMPEQATGIRRSRALPYALDVEPAVTGRGVELVFRNDGQAGAVFHVYDRLRREAVPRRYTVDAGAVLHGAWPAEASAAHDLWVLGPNGFHRHAIGVAQDDALRVAARSDTKDGAIALTLTNPGATARRVEIRPMAYAGMLAARDIALAPGQSVVVRWPLAETSGWYDLAVRLPDEPGFLRRLAGRVESGRDTISDPAMRGTALAVHAV